MYREGRRKINEANGVQAGSWVSVAGRYNPQESLATATGYVRGCEDERGDFAGAAAGGDSCLIGWGMGRWLG